MPETPADVVLVDLGPSGLRARRTGTGPGEPTHAAVDARRPRPGDPFDAESLLAAVSGLAGGPVPAAVVVAVPDVARALDPHALLAGARAVFGSPATVVVDGAVATLTGALAAVAPGVVLEMGVGTRVLATDFDQVWHRVDGWGALLGDRGSAAWIGAQGLAAGLRHRDGIADGSRELLDAGRHAFGDEWNWPELLDRHGAALLLADFAPVVGELATRDRVAEGICRLAGEQLADSIDAGAELLPGAPLAATGALLLVDAVKVSFASALGRRHRFLLPALGDSLAGCRVIADHLVARRRFVHRPPYTFVQGHGAIGG